MVKKKPAADTTSFRIIDIEARKKSVARTPALVLLHAPGFEQLSCAYPIPMDNTPIGSDPACAIHLPLATISRHHADIFRAPEGFVLFDKESHNGTFVDGRPIDHEEIEPGVQIRFGNVLFKLVADEASSYARYRIDGARYGESSEQARQRGLWSLLVGGLQMHRIEVSIEEIARSDCSVLALGETGTGKELVARTVHRASGRRGPLHVVNCAAIPANMVEGQLFGWKRGAFTGAAADARGHFQAAEGGTLFLDEIGELSLEAQAKLLRAVEHKEVTPLGSHVPERVNVRIVAATHRDLEARIAAGTFREDLYARLADMVVRLPPLRERKEDIYQLARYFAARHHRPELRVDDAAMLALLHYAFPRNVRELESIIRMATLRARGDVIPLEALPPEVRRVVRDSWANDRGSRPSREEEPADVDPSVVTANELRDLLARHKGNVTQVAQELGMSRQSTYRVIERAGLRVEDFRAG